MQIKHSILKRLVAIVMITALTVGFAGCNDKGGEATQGTQSGQSVRIEELRQTTANADDITFSGNEDSQAYWNVYTHVSARGKYGYYYTAYASRGLGQILCFMDDETLESMPLCNDAQCDHTSSSCSAIFLNYAGQVWYYKDYIYMIKYTEGKAVLVRINEDGTDRKELFEIGNVPTDNANTYCLAFADDSVYVSDFTGNCRLREPMPICIRRIALDNSSSEEIVTSEEANAIFDCVKTYGNNVFFIYSNTEYIRETGQNVTTSHGLYCYNPEKKQTVKVIDKNISDYAIDMDNGIIYYYVIDEGLYEYNLKDKNEKLIYKAERNTSLCQISFDGDNIYLDNQRWCTFTRTKDLVCTMYVLDRSGNLINSIDTSETIRVMFGDSEYVLFELGGKTNVNYISQHRIGYIKKSEIATADSWNVSEWQ